jgi:hypothetical protein
MLRKLVLWGTLLLLTILGVAVGYVVYDQKSRWTPDEVEQAVTEALPPGSTREQVVAFLDAKGFPRQTYRSYGDTSARYFGIPEDDFGELIDADVPHPGLGFLTGGWIRVDFYMDKNGRLIKYHMNVQRYNL